MKKSVGGKATKKTAGSTLMGKGTSVVSPSVVGAKKVKIGKDALAVVKKGVIGAKKEVKVAKVANVLAKDASALVNITVRDKRTVRNVLPADNRTKVNKSSMPQSKVESSQKQKRMAIIVSLATLAAILITVVALVTVGVFGSTEEKTELTSTTSKPRLKMVPNYTIQYLTDMCVRAFGPCFYHTDKYAQNCLSIECSTVLVSIEHYSDLRVNKWMTKFMAQLQEPQQLDISATMGVPCIVSSSQKGLCLRGKCSAYTSPLMKAYEAQGGIDGGWKKNDGTCVVFSTDALARFSSLRNFDCTFDSIINCTSYIIELNSCIAPLPSLGGKPCFTGETDSGYVRNSNLILKARQCPDCYADAHPEIDCSAIDLTERCDQSMFRFSPTYSKEKTPCCVEPNEQGVCLGGVCVQIIQ